MEQDYLTKPDRIYTVSEIIRLVRLELESAFPFVWVEGEISNFRRYPSGHLYFTLKDESCQLRVVIFRSEARLIPFEIKDGLKVICKGRINVYESRGELQLIAEVVEPKGKGALQLAFEQLKEKLKKEGLFDPQHKKRLPLFPKKVGVVTSPRGAAIVDIIRTLERRFARLHLLLYPVKVQGEGAAEEIVEGIEYLGKIPDLDAIIVGRGGGSIEDLWAFNEEKVARAIFRCPIPIISAVGHEIDFTIADFVADLRASTPSAAAEMVIEKEEAFLERIESMEKRIIQAYRYLFEERRNKVLSLLQHRAFPNFKVKLLNLEQKIDELEQKVWESFHGTRQLITEARAKLTLIQEKMQSVIKKEIQHFSAHWERLSAGLHNLSPLNILKKGYTICWTNGGERLIRKIEEVNKEDEVTVSFFKGEFICFVKEVDRVREIQSRLTKEKR